METSFLYTSKAIQIDFKGFVDVLGATVLKE